MNWKNQIRQASFRGVEFFVSESSDQLGGRRVALHEYPHRNMPYAEDLGRTTHDYQIEGYVTGSNYMAQRDQLIQATQKPGPGELIHYRLGRLQLICKSCQVKESNSEAGIAWMSMSFVESAENEYPEAKRAPSAFLAKSRNQIKQTSVENFIKGFSIKNQPDFVVEQALQDFLNFLSHMLDEENQQFQSHQNHIKEKNQYPASAEIAETVFNVLTRTDRQKKPVVFKPLPVSKISESPQSKNRKAFQTLIQRADLITEIKQIETQNFANQNEALNYQQILNQKLDLEIETARAEDIHQFQKLKTAVSTYILETAPLLDKTRMIKLNVSEPALVLAYRLYEDAERDTQIIKRNLIAHPGFLPINKNLEVVNND